MVLINDVTSITDISKMLGKLLKHRERAYIGIVFNDNTILLLSVIIVYLTSIYGTVVLNRDNTEFNKSMYTN